MTPQRSAKLKEINWAKAYNGLQVRKPKFGVVIPGVPITDIDPQNIDQETLVRIEEANKIKNLKIASITPLRRKAYISQDASEKPGENSFIIFVHDPDTADRCLKSEIYIRYRNYPA